MLFCSYLLKHPSQVKTEIIGNVKKPFFFLSLIRDPQAACLDPTLSTSASSEKHPFPQSPHGIQPSPHAAICLSVLRSLMGHTGLDLSWRRLIFFLPWTPCWVVTANIHLWEDTLVSALSCPFTFPIKGKPLRVDGCVSVICVVSIMQLRSVGRRPEKKHTQLKDQE